ncbi:hypothetical protein [Pseudonocardia nigra]|uniref:hypothetical protein n=1 Tax=Pseudonocardia nigra TaxID=1921578 RepID=UPI001C5DCCC2|nr:hypothetical protein [Pseudonocardia nigra]
MARLGLLPVIAARAQQDGRVTIGALHEWSRDAVETVLNLIVDGLLPDQLHLADELAEFRAYRALFDIEAAMPAVVITGR